jgi:hypothetical protein
MIIETMMAYPWVVAALIICAAIGLVMFTNRDPKDGYDEL